ncbi:MAG: dockerin type I repeat-containing protein [Phycisphaerales bacterium]|nr:dockerin type I repeat-containing protein [Phycisphaerales bacterium]
MTSLKRVLVSASLLAIMTATACQNGQLPAPRSAHPLADGLPNGKTRGTIDLPVIELTSGGSAQTTFEPTIITTTSIPQRTGQRKPWIGETKRPGKLLPPHSRDKTLKQGPANNLQAGGLLEEKRVDSLSFFPAIQQGPWNPPDPSLAVGPNHVVVTVNMAVAFYDKEGNEQFFANLDDTGDPGFFEDIGAGSFTFDPKCFYDPTIERFIILALEVYNDPDEGWMTIAISDDSDPNGTWYKYRTWAVITNDNDEYWPDYPGLGFDDQAFYVTSNLFGFDGGFLGAIYRIFPKEDMLDGQPLTVTDVLDSSSASVQVAQCLDSRDSTLFVSRNNSTSIRLQTIQDPLGTPQLFTANVSVPNYNSPINDAPNLGGGELDTLDGRIMNAMWRDNGLWTAHAIIGTGGNTRARWYNFDVNGFPGGSTPSLIQSGNVDMGSGNFVFFPAIASNRFGDVAMVFAKSNAQEYASIQATGRRSTDIQGVMGNLTELAVGTAGSEGRWGDYFDITVDPVDDTSFWMVGEYVTTFEGNVIWETWINKFEISCPGDVNGDDVVNVNDVLTVLAGFGGLGSGGDANGDGVINVNDVLIVISSWGNCP